MALSFLSLLYTIYTTFSLQEVSSRQGDGNSPKKYLPNLWSFDSNSGCYVNASLIMQKGISASTLETPNIHSKVIL